MFSINIIIISPLLKVIIYKERWKGFRQRLYKVYIIIIIIL